jgi:hypothetical protein
MAEDRGAFKTNPRNPGQIRHFVIRTLPGNTRIGAVSSRRFRPFCRPFWPRLFEPTAGRGLLYSGFSLIRGGEGG